MTEDLQQLKALAMAATPGPWNQDKYGNIKPAVLNEWRYSLRVSGVSLTGSEEAQNNSAFIASANPATILALIARIESLAADAEGNVMVLEKAKTALKAADYAIKGRENTNFIYNAIDAIDAAIAKEKA